MKKVLFVINTLGLAGAERALIALLETMPKEEYEISLYVLLNQGELRNEIPEHVKLMNGSLDETPIHSPEGLKKVKKTAVSRMFQKGRFIRYIPYLTVHGIHMLFKGGFRFDRLLWQAVADGGERINEHFDTAIAYIEGGSAYYVDRYVHADHKIGFIHVDYVRAGYSVGIDRNCYTRFDKIFAVSGEVRDSFLKVYPALADRTGVFENVINIDRITKASQEPGGFDDDYDGIRILTVGRLNEQKGYPNSIEAMKILKDRGIRARWYVLGEGDKRAELTALINRLDLSEDFLLLGNRSNPYPYFRQCDLYVHCSRFEGKSIAVREAKILGCTVVVSDSNGNREQIRDKVEGRVIDPSPQNIAATIEELVNDKEERLKYAQNAKASENAAVDSYKILFE